jgi:hypothetical protein
MPKPSPSRLDRIEKRCRECSEEYKGLERAVYTYAAEEGLERPLVRELARHRRLLGRMPPSFSGMTVGALVMHRVLGSELALRRFAAKAGYAPADRDSYEAMSEKAWQVLLFEIKKRVAEDFFLVAPIGADPEGGELLHSPSLERLTVGRSSLFLTGSYSIGECSQTFGPVLPLESFSPEDVSTFASLLAPDLFASEGFAAVLRRQPLSFYLLYAFASVPRIAHGGRPIVYSASELRFKEGFLGSISSLGPRERAAKGNWVAHLKKDWDGLSFVDLVVSEKGRKAILLASDPSRYEAAAAESPFDVFPPRPRWTASMPMIAAIKEILGKDFPGLAEQSDQGRAEAREPAADAGAGSATSRGEPTEEELASLNRAVAELSDAVNDGRSPDIGDIARRHGLDIASFEQIAAQITRRTKLADMDLPHGFSDYTPPPPTLRSRLVRPLDEAGLFDLASDPELEEDLASRRQKFKPYLPRGHRGPVTLTRLPTILARATSAFFGKEGPLALSYTAFLLHERGETYRGVSDYACELLRIFGHVLLQGPGAERIEAFERRYADWVFRVLGPFGLVDFADGPGTENGEESGAAVVAARSPSDAQARMKRSSFFERWLVWK